jgi:hypothetical protein
MSVGWLVAERSEAPESRGLGTYFVRPQPPQDDAPTQGQISFAAARRPFLSLLFVDAG